VCGDNDDDVDEGDDVDDVLYKLPDDLDLLCVGVDVVCDVVIVAVVLLKDSEVAGIGTRETEERVEREGGCDCF